MVEISWYAAQAFCEWVGVVLKLLLGVGLGFELPVVLLTLVRIGILDYRKLNALRCAGHGR